VMFINVPIGLVIILLAHVSFLSRHATVDALTSRAPRWSRADSRPWIYGFIRIAEHGNDLDHRRILRAQWSRCLVSFVRVERTRVQPLLPMRLVTDRLRGRPISP